MVLVKREVYDKQKTDNTTKCQPGWRWKKQVAGAVDHHGRRSQPGLEETIGKNPWYKRVFKVFYRRQPSSEALSRSLSNDDDVLEYERKPRIELDRSAPKAKGFNRAEMESSAPIKAKGISMAEMESSAPIKAKGISIPAPIKAKGISMAEMESSAPIKAKGFSMAEMDSSAPAKAKGINMAEMDSSAATAKGLNIREIIADPDGDGDSSILCTACTLPIFSTPCISFSHKFFMHDQCANNQPQQLLHELHPGHPLFLLTHLPNPNPTPTTCSNCNRICGTVLYQCAACDFRLDLVCVMQIIKIVHRSHPHSMMVIRLREAASPTCSACDTKHEPSSSSESAALSYLCNLCGYWIHPDCASLPNAIVRYEEHHHSLFLAYKHDTAAHSKCVICFDLPKRGSWVYICLHCPSYYLVHLRCALASPKAFHPVLIEEARVAELCRLPLADENTSLIPYIRERSCDRDDHLDQHQLHPHPHPLTLHQTDDANCKQSSSRVCNACVQSISSPPFLSCSQCPAFFLHACCAHLPTEIQHPVHQHPLFLAPTSSPFHCKGCELQCNGFAYSCKSCDDFSLDVGCASINPAITHASHKKTHILFMRRDIQFGSHEICNCCASGLSGICYECSICSNFKLHVRCALLPSTVRHVFDEHPLQLITNGDGDDAFCEVCEKEFDTKRWYYSCRQCNQSFHIHCIPSVAHLSRIK